MDDWDGKDRRHAPATNAGVAHASLADSAGTNIDASSAGSAANKLMLSVDSVATTAGDSIEACWTADAEL